MTPIETMLAGAVAALAGAIGVMFKIFMDRSRECEEDRQKLWERIANMDTKNRAAEH